MNLPAVKRRVESLAGRRTVKQQWQVRKICLEMMTAVMNLGVDVIKRKSFDSCLRFSGGVASQSCHLHRPYHLGNNLSVLKYS